MIDAPATANAIDWELYSLRREREDLRDRIMRMSLALAALVTQLKPLLPSKPTPAAKPKPVEGERYRHYQDHVRFILANTPQGFRPDFAALTQLAERDGRFNHHTHMRCDYELSLRLGWKRYRAGQVQP